MSKRRGRNKILSLLLSLALIMTMIPYGVFAETAESAAESENRTVSYSWVNPAYEGVLGEEDLISGGAAAVVYSSDIDYATTPEEAAEIVRECLVNRAGTFAFNYKYPIANGIGEDWFGKLCDEIFTQAYEHTGTANEGDYICYTLGGYGASTSYSIDETYYYLSITVTVTYYTSYDQEEAVTEAARSLLSGIITDDMTDYGKVKAIYDYMTANIKYDYANLNDDNYDLKYTAYAALINKTAVCQGYANLFYRLALECGIDARIITGQAGLGAHGWNIVKLGSKYYSVDATWDASRAQAGLAYEYFLLPSFSDHETDAAFLTDEFLAAYPMADSAYVEGSEPDTECTHAETVELKAIAATCTESGLTAGIKCASCGKIITAQKKVAALGHSWETNYTVDKKASCTEAGSKSIHCTRCDATKNVTAIPAASTVNLSASSYTYNGKAVSPAVIVRDSNGSDISDDNYTVTTPAGRKNAGTYTYKVTFKNDYTGSKNLTLTINPAKLTSASLSATTYAYNGKVKTPTVTAKAGALTAASKISKDTGSIDITYAKGRKNVGTYKVTVKGQGNYTGTITKTFKINPKATSITSRKGAKKAFTVKWKKQSAQVTGYQIRYSTSSKMTGAKTVTVKSYKTTSKKITKLKAKKKYYVQVRSYKKVSGKTYYSAWSAKKYVSTK